VNRIEDYMRELSDGLHTRGRPRRRFLRECRDHLADSAAARGEGDAIRAFGPPRELAVAFDTEVAARRGTRSTFLAAAGVTATGGSTLAMIHAASGGVTAPTLWAILFFVAAQLAGAAAALALVQALAGRRSALAPAQALLLARRNTTALVAAGVTMFAAGAAVPGRGSAALILMGPTLVCIALVAVMRARRLVRRLGGRRAAFRPPLEDIATLIRLPLPSVEPLRLLALTTSVAAAAAFLRDRAEHAGASQALLTAGIEATAVVGCFLLLGRALGVRPALLAKARHRN
jgi:hypothetical protein